MSHEAFLAPYLSPDQREDRFEQLTRAAESEMFAFGTSVEGRPLRAAILPAQGAHPKRVLISAGIHGVEYLPCQIALEILHRMRTANKTLSSLRRLAEIWIIPCLNPDGYARTWFHQGKGPLAKLRTNARGVDLNRNFPLPSHQQRIHLPFSGARQKGKATYTGPHPLSEPETSALAHLVNAHPFHASVNLHCFMGTIIPARVTDRAAYHHYKNLSWRLALAQPDHPYRRLSNRLFDVYTGELEDFLHHHHSCWSVCLESFPLYASFLQNLRSPSVFWRFNPKDFTPWLKNDIPGIFNFLLAALHLPTVEELREKSRHIPSSSSSRVLFHG